MKRIVVLGGYGNMGKVVAGDLFASCKDCEIVIAGRDLKAARSFARSFKDSRVKGFAVDVKDINSTAKLLKGAAVCINCIVYYFNLHVMKACLKAGVHYLDLGGLFHMTRKQLKLNSAFRKKNVLAILGCGSTPGITNAMAAYGARFFDRVKEMNFSFGDADFTKYKQPFVLPYTMHTLFDEYTLRPPVFMKGRLKFLKPHSGKAIIEYPKPVGRAVGFYGIHSELATMPKSFKEKGIRKCSFTLTFPPDFNSQIEFLINAGFASEKEMLVGGAKVKPKDFTAKIMEQWLPKPGTKVRDLEYLRVEIKGSRKGKHKKLAVYCLTKSRFNIPAGTYDTGVPPSIIGQMIAKCIIKAKGVLPPELCVPPLPFFKELKKRGIKVFVKKVK